ncbi:MAG: hypothetical protein MJ249_11775 [Kiritimatiellae bacterium]|nr:hypothetical protein [Kiritimatiellia bacterium]
MEKISTDIYSFENLRKDGYVYVDKTDRKGALKLILDWYDSYRFSHLSTARVCNPISVFEGCTATSTSRSSACIRGSENTFS